ncbi:MAG: DUF86 domain-containing protein [Halobacteriota archaeon]|jgi:uncharacterized protein YutE (UPF0331/DUF86 family)|uniref:DUF86 domain-containing protein n=1 Tax=Uncultured archaeon GZfos26G2 TaxID=3386331 RepID=Q649Z0_UNCAG|nr:conserved hypothetical protein [uncultured archaeon GZfos33H6]
MNEDIKKRIMEKVEIVIERVEFIEGHLSNEILGNRILRKAIYKEFQEAVEAVSDVCAMLRRGLNSSAKDDYSNIEFLVEHDILKEKKAEKLKEANGLRNRLIHGYDSVDDETACYAIIELIEDLRDFPVVVLEWIRKNNS